jgi:hypothetical protein
MELNSSKAGDVLPDLFAIAATSDFILSGRIFLGLSSSSWRALREGVFFVALGAWSGRKNMRLGSWTAKI